MNELNEKLAKWAGFKFNVYRRDARLWTEFPNGDFTNTEFEYDAMPNFIQSLDACFKWLVPKLYLELCKEGQYFKIRAIYKALEDSVIAGSSGDYNPALALCLAIEKLIDSEVKDGS